MLSIIVSSGSPSKTCPGGLQVASPIIFAPFLVKIVSIQTNNRPRLGARDFEGEPFLVCRHGSATSPRLYKERPIS